VTLVGNDSGLFQFAAAEHPERIARLVITSCEAFENFPPGLPGTNLWLAAKLPGGVNASVQPLRLRALRRLPVAYGWMAKRPIPHEVTDAWLRPLLTRREIRRDLTKYLRSFDRPALVIGATEDRVMPPSTDAASPSCCPARGWWRSPTATRSSPRTSLPNWLGCFASSCASRLQPPAKREASAIKAVATRTRRCLLSTSWRLSQRFCGGKWREPLSRYEVEVETSTGKLRTVGRPRLFGLDALGEGGWLKAMRLDGYAFRAPRRPRSLQQALFPYAEAL
jgi:hypothetical protein